MPSEFNILLLPLLGGFLFLVQLNRTKYRFQRQSGYGFLFYSMIFGIFLFVFSQVLVHLVLLLSDKWEFIESTVTWWSKSYPEKHSGVASLSFFIGLLSPSLLNPSVFEKSKQLSRAIRDEGEAFEQILEKSIENTSLVSLTLRNGKVYIGAVTGNYVPGRERKYLKIIPFYSGYRNQADMTLKLNTTYIHVYDKVIEGQLPSLTSVEDFEFVILVSEIISINLFDINAFEKFQEEANNNLM